MVESRDALRLSMAAVCGWERQAPRRSRPYVLDRASIRDPATPTLLPPLCRRSRCCAPANTAPMGAGATPTTYRSVVLCQPEAVVLAPASCQHQEGEQEVAPLPREQLWGREPWTRGGSRRWPSSEPGGGARSLAQATSFPPPRTRGSSLCRATSAKDANAESSEQEDFPLMAAGAAAWRSSGIMSGEP
jgi:hypothetical protein